MSKAPKIVATRAEDQHLADAFNRLAIEPGWKEAWSRALEAELARPSLHQSLLGAGVIREAKPWQIPWIRFRRNVLSRLRLIGLAFCRIGTVEDHLYPED